jgi:hypothetical protein
MTDQPLSPAAQAVKDAAQDAYWLWDSMCPADAETIAAAALRAAADQVAPDEPYPENSQFWEDDEAIQEWHSKQYFRKRNLAIAAELEAQ